jgi:hypothetical protein
MDLAQSGIEGLIAAQRRGARTGMKIERLVLASNNAGKLRELSAMLAPLGIEVVTQGSLGVTEAEEPHATFVENALAKARHAARVRPDCRRWPTTPACVCGRSAASRVCCRHAMPANRSPMPRTTHGWSPICTA